MSGGEGSVVDLNRDEDSVAAMRRLLFYIFYSRDRERV